MSSTLDIVVAEQLVLEIKAVEQVTCPPRAADLLLANIEAARGPADEFQRADPAGWDQASCHVILDVFCVSSNLRGQRRR
jgi:hypothetical protein